jgi:tetratricopeptide (TPR) repeat protein
MTVRITLCLLVLVACGCRSISSIRTTETQPGNRGYIVGGPGVAKPGTLTRTEAERARDEGVALFTRQPRNLERAALAASKLETAAQVLTDDFNAQVNAAQTWAFVAENEAQADTRRNAAKRGIVAARRARELEPSRVEGHYWYAVNVGFLADVDRSYGLSAVSEMEPSLKRAGEIDARYDYAGPLRVLGVLVLRTPPPPVSIGSARKALRLLQRAVESFPEHSENYIYFGEALCENARTEEARVEWRKAVVLPAPSDRQFESRQWQNKLSKLLAANSGK